MMPPSGLAGQIVRLTLSQGQGLFKSSLAPNPCLAQLPLGQLAKRGRAARGWTQENQQVQTQPEPARAWMLGWEEKRTGSACSTSRWGRSLGVSWREHGLCHPA